ncbi:CPBP family intramembrane metalloprotease [Niabella sp. CC-SYL272]|uniref:CPBP family intramembrane glutamic endopeptidase n=1 Tax=Niabella agricola TaxID=2891571 RepID=UPI001F3FD512|nr:CPBP family intramembrane glutamic endopeptidase [Niabella agricola]MCF3111332.1 CPBP family intramembrane metalloprotease [Niabella agricola]
MMTDLDKKDISYTAGFFMLIAFGVGGMFLAGAIGGIAWNLMTGKGLAELAAAVGNPAYLREMQLLQTLQALFGFLAPTLVTASFLSHKPLKLVGFSQKPEGDLVVLSIVLILCGLGVSAGLGHLSYQLPLPVSVKAQFDQWEQVYAAQAAGLVSFKSIPDLLLSILVLALVPAVCEEAFFRGGLQNFMYRGNGNRWMAVIVVSLIFSIVHMSGYGFLSRLALGVILGLIYQLSGNIWLSILAHFINNALAVIAMYLQVQSGKSLAEAMSDKSGSYLGLMAVPVVAVLFMWMNKKIKQKKPADGI